MCFPGTRDIITLQTDWSPESPRDKLLKKGKSIIAAFSEWLDQVLPYVPDLHNFRSRHIRTIQADGEQVWHGALHRVNECSFRFRSLISQEMTKVKSDSH